ncbi:MULTISPECIES: YciK family oxidoreductase [unclassified Pseudomonas]|uniref:YciK family oxidoreductase n=1 Tax=unclassified Pseudomonas TaxID=196821 RepID=UPI000BDA48F6|nr:MULTISPECIES: YciK family oxidoreductase [unclassified Pseudomonas]PVZ20228.1 NAD(P)-dependent dehydrogenase (short-subunit alcohol dehydrogenase family) [Pseudomonas sp. URIL14HWK12:I12]PVZ27294.1 NAD(P)-dependent dehydrogenase (short-subunit alcohol dehydrogenase family) [Pseudomonas sp. URIL14HWK12:I10]PVZ38183.1 NAD(P)-dependent dehydrogenase (short-subunit alcohol dehydrogenase family) [Pseudomonas sp. URIL14HWK12:I11]SNZ04311.1 NAD(P)-dependent dehydrogenase, short-chain alcohol dehydr
MITFFNYQAPPDLLKGRRILVTGAGRGIGAAAALAYAAQGAEVLLLGRALSNLQSTAEAVSAAGYRRPQCLEHDLLSATAADCQALAARIGGHLDGVLHNASLIGPRLPIAQLPEAEFTEVMQVNVNGTFLLTQALLPLLHRAPADASLIFTSSSVGRQGRAEWGAYAVSKFATEGLMQTLADELVGSRVRANSINPGGTRTDMRAKAYPNEDPTRNPEPWQIMPVYLYLMGPDSAALNGQALNARA